MRFSNVVESSCRSVGDCLFDKESTETSNVEPIFVDHMALINFWGIANNLSANIIMVYRIGSGAR